MLSIGGFVQVRGGFAFSKSDPVLATLSDGKSKNLQVTTFGFNNLSAFVGAGPYWNVNGDGTFSDTPNPDAAGLLLSNGKLALALFKPTDRSDTSSYYSVNAALESVSLPGLASGGSSDSFELSASGYRIEVNGGTNDVAVDFTSLNNGRLTVDTSTSNSIDFAYTSYLQKVAIENATLSIGEYVYVSGGLSFTKYKDLKVKFSNPEKTDLMVNAYAFGAGSVDLFVGSGSYFVDTHTSPDPPTTTARGEGADGVIDEFDNRNTEAVGLAMENVNFGLIIMRPTMDTATKYLALKATADSVGMVGIDDFKLSASGISVEYNTVKKTGATSTTPVVDFKASFGDWSRADKPFQFLAAVVAYKEYCDHGAGYVCHLPPSLDGTNSGTQHYAAATLNAVDGYLVNLVPNDACQDVYGVVAKAVEEEK